MSEDRTLVDGGKWLASTLRTEGQRERAMLVEGLYDHIVTLEAEIKQLTEGAIEGYAFRSQGSIDGEPFRDVPGCWELLELHYCDADDKETGTLARLILTQTPGEKT